MAQELDTQRGMVRVISILLLMSSFAFASESFLASEGYNDDDETDTNYTDAYEMKKSAVKPSLAKEKSKVNHNKKQLKRQPGERSDRGLPFSDDDLEDDLK